MRVLITASLNSLGTSIVRDVYQDILKTAIGHYNVLTAPLRPATYLHDITSTFLQYIQAYISILGSHTHLNISPNIISQFYILTHISILRTNAHLNTTH